MSAYDPPKRTSRTIKDDFRRLLVAPPYLVADFLGDHSIADISRASDVNLLGRTIALKSRRARHNLRLFFCHGRAAVLLD